MFTQKKIALAISLSLASAGVFASGSVAFENKSFQIRYGKTQDKYLCFARNNLTPSFTECPTPRVFGGNDPIARSLFLYKNGMIVSSKTKTNSRNFEMCLTGRERKLSFDTCSNGVLQKFSFEVRNYITGSYAIKHTQLQLCVTKLGDDNSSVEMSECDPNDEDQEYTPRLMTDAIQYTVVNENGGDQDLELGLYEFAGKTPFWIEDLRNIRHGYPQRRLIADFSSYGLRGRFILKNSPTYNPLYIVDNHAGDVTTITMPLTGEMKKTIDAPNAPIMTSKVPPRPTPPIVPAPSILPQLFRILNDVADTGFHRTDGTASFTVPEGWILNVFKEPNFKSGPTRLTSTSTTFPKNIGSIDVTQKAGSPIRLRNDTVKSKRAGEITVKNASGTLWFYQDTYYLGPLDKGSDSRQNKIFSYINSSPPGNEKNGFYIQKTVSSSGKPFSDRETWEPLNIGSWNPGSGRRDELYARDSDSENISTIWRLRKDGPMACIPSNTESIDSWEYLGSMKGWMNTISSTGEGLYIYRDRDYGGRKIKITENVADLCDFSNHMSSFQIPSGWEVRFYTDKNFTGGSYTRRYSESSDSDLEGKIKSIQIIRR